MKHAITLQRPYKKLGEIRVPKPIEIEKITRPRLCVRRMPELQIKLLNLMKLIVEAQWIINEEIYLDMLKLAGYDQLISAWNEHNK